MLHRVVIENFFSIADRQELIFAVTNKAPELPCFKSSPSMPEVRLPTVVGFFGPNASGKSTILRAVISAMVFTCHSFNWGSDLSFFFSTIQK